MRRPSPAYWLRTAARVARRIAARALPVVTSDSQAAGGEACTKKCVAAGEKMVIVTDGDSKVMAVDNQDALKGHEGHHVAVTGTMSKESIHVNSVKML